MGDKPNCSNDGVNVKSMPRGTQMFSRTRTPKWSTDTHPNNQSPYGVFSYYCSFLSTYCTSKLKYLLILIFSTTMVSNML